jgi:hypothetical protein
MILTNDQIRKCAQRKPMAMEGDEHVIKGDDGS